MTDLIIYRTCDRHKYTEITLPLNIERSNLEDTVFLVADNSTDEEAAKEVADPYVNGGDVRFFRASGARIGGPNMINEALTRYQRRIEDLRYIFVLDDDVIAPEPLETGEKWNDVLVEMLDAGWDIVAHPWASDFRKGSTREIGGVEGHPHSGVGGGCSGFHFEHYLDHPIMQATKIRGYNEWMVRHNRKRNGYSHRGTMTIQHIDRADHELSLRDTEYAEWSDEMFYERFPKAKEQGKTRPRGVKGSW